MKEGKIIAFYNRKGGVGKTTLSGNFAAFLSKIVRKRGETVCYLDMDSQVNAATTFLGFDREELSKPIEEYPNILNLVGINAPYLNTKIPKLPIDTLIMKADLNLYSIPPSDNMELYWKKTEKYTDNWEVLMQPFRELRKHMDYIILDLPPAQDDLTYSALAASDYLVIPAECDKSSISNLDYFTKEVVPTFQMINPSFKILGIVMNKCDRYSDAFYNEVLSPTARKNGIDVFRTRINVSSGLKDPNNKAEGYTKGLRSKAKLDRCVVAYDNFVFKTYPRAYHDIKDFTEEVLQKIGK